MSSWKQDWSGLRHDPPAWLREKRFGLFFHWGVYSVPACENEWYSRNMYLKGSRQNLAHEARYGKISSFGYKDLIPLWKAERFDPDAWAALVDESGAGYGGPVAEHADGFSLWDSQVNPVNACRMGPKRDILAACAEAFQRRGLRLITTMHHQWLWGWFMSTDPDADVYRPENEKFYGPSLPLETNRYQPYRLPDSRFCDTWLEKVREVSETYRPAMMGFDSRLNILPETVLREAVRCYYAAVPDGIVTFKQNDLPAGIGMTDVECGRFAQIQPSLWQTDDRLEDRVTWSIVDEPKYRCAGEVIQQLADTAAKNGVLLLNVGPSADGSFHPEAVRILRRIGSWLQVNGEAIRGTVPCGVPGEGPSVSSNEDYNTERLKRQLREGIVMESGRFALTGEDVRYTQNDHAVFVIGFGMPKDRTLRLRNLMPDRCTALQAPRLLGSDQDVCMETEAGCVTLRLPEQLPFPEAYVIRIRKKEGGACGC